ncbi:hypothetical protein LguiA_001335 [Lonicera macranthoides]
MEVTSSNVVVGSRVWVEDPEVAWIDGEVVEVKGEEIKIKCSSGKEVVANASNVYPLDTEAPSAGVDDMTTLSYLHEPGVLYNLRCRYDLNEIYTYTGNILIAVNPFQRLPHLYDMQVMEKYKGAAFGELSPHPFAIADSAYRQAVISCFHFQVLSGIVFLMQRTNSFFLKCRQMINEGISQAILVSGESGAGKTESTKQLMRYLAYMGGRAASEGRSVEQQVLESNPVLEAFGNAKTLRNNNSSRFGKFVEIQFDQRGRISGAAVRTYLLERSRVCQVSDPERNYHCFYMLCAAPPESNMKSVTDLIGVKIDSNTDSFKLNNSVQYEILRNGENAKRTLSVKDVGKYKLGNPRMFHYLNQSNCFQLDGVDESKEYLATKRAMDVVGISSSEQEAIFRVVAAVLHLGNIEFAKGREADSSEPKDDQSRFHLQIAAELFMCDEKALEDSLCKRVIVTRDETITKNLDLVSATLCRDALAKIHVFKMEQEEYTKEEIDWSYIEFVDNQDILDLIEKNKDYVIAEHQALLSASNCSFVSGLFPPLPEESSKTSKFSSIASQFKQQLQSLLETLSATEPHYVRCVKPNNLLKPSIFENENVLQQLRCGGVLEAIRISCAGFPTRKTFDEFIYRFRILAPSVLSGSYDGPTASKKLLEKVDLKGYQIGKTKVFLRAGQMAELDAHRIEILGRSASVIQRKVRTYFERKRFLLLRSSSIQIQALCRAQVGRNRYERMRREAACKVIQKNGRMYVARKCYKTLCASAVYIQSGMRAMAARGELLFRKQTKAAILIQTQCRRYLACHRYKRTKRAAIVTQCAWRRRMARRELRRLRMAAKDAGALQDAKAKLEKEVEELSLQLEQEKRLREEMQLQLQETKEQLLKEREAAKRGGQVLLTQDVPVMDQELINKHKAENDKLEENVPAGEAEQVTVVTEVVVSDNETINKLTAENQKLKALVSSLEKEADEAKHQAREAESQNIHLKTTMQSLQERVSDLEDEKILQKQASLASASRKIPERLTSTKSQGLRSAPPSKKYGTESDKDMRRSMLEKQRIPSLDLPSQTPSHENDYNLVSAVDLFITSYQMMQNNREKEYMKRVGYPQAMAHKRSSTHVLKPTGAASTRPPPSPSPSLFERMTQRLRSGNYSFSRIDFVRNVEAKYPAMLFKQQLTAYVEKIATIIRDNLKKELSELMSSYIKREERKQTDNIDRRKGGRRRLLEKEENTPTRESDNRGEDVVNRRKRKQRRHRRPEKMVDWAPTLSS